MRRERIEELFYIRAICAFGIFMIHLSGNFAVTSIYASRAMYMGIFANQFFRFGTPIFMMISGFVLFYNYRTAEEFNYTKFYKKKVLFILVPFIIWSLFYYLALPFILSPYSEYMMKRYEALLSLDFMEIKALIKTIMLGSAYPHLYFIFLIFQFYLLYPLFMKYLIKPMENRPVKFFIITYILQTIILLYGYFFKNIFDNPLVNLFNAYYVRLAISWFYYFLTGGLLALHYKKIVDFIEKNIARIMPFYLLITTIYLGEVYYNIYQHQSRDFYGKFGSIRPSTMIYATITMPVLIWLGRKIHQSRYRKMLKDIGVYSLGIYFAHPFVLELIKVKIINEYPAILGYSRISTLIFLIVVGWICTYGLVLLISVLKCNSLLLGKVPAFKIKKSEFKVQDS